MFWPFAMKAAAECHNFLSLAAQRAIGRQWTTTRKRETEGPLAEEGYEGVNGGCVGWGRTAASSTTSAAAASLILVLAKTGVACGPLD